MSIHHVSNSIRDRHLGPTFESRLGHVCTVFMSGNLTGLCLYIYMDNGTTTVYICPERDSNLGLSMSHRVKYEVP